MHVHIHAKENDQTIMTNRLVSDVGAREWCRPLDSNDGAYTLNYTISRR